MCQKPEFEREGSLVDAAATWQQLQQLNGHAKEKEAADEQTGSGAMPAARFWGRYLLYPGAWAVARATGVGEHLMPMLALGTLLRYMVNLAFTVMSKLDSLAEPVRISRFNPPSKQHERELDWDGPVILSPVAFLLVDWVTPLLRAERCVPLSWSGFWTMVVGHYLVTEPLYYYLHRWLHTPYGYKASHYHHHLSTTTEAISGTSHPLGETVAYLANFSFPFLVPAALGHFSLTMIPIYFVWFDIMNCIGHCNFECVPRFMQWGPLKYLTYTSSYHSLHHTKYKFNFCLFCPIWDYLAGTVHPTTDELHATVLGQRPRKVAAVFLGHGHGINSMAHLPWLSPYLASQEHKARWWLLPLRPFLLLWVAICRWCLSTAVVQRYHYRGTQCATWCLPVTGHFYLQKSQLGAISRMILKAVIDADEQGVRYIGLAALNKAEWLNHGGADILPLLGERKIRIVHGNTLTAGAVYHALCARTKPTDAVFITGATSKIGRVLCLLLARRGNAVRMLTSCQLRFNAIRAEAGADAHRLSKHTSYAEGADCPVWVIGKWATADELERHVMPGGVVVDYAVPHITPTKESRFRYINGAALRYDARETDLTFCHDVPGTMPACLAATIIHARDELREHETGEVDVDHVEEWWQRAIRHGFSLDV